ncbi:MAG: helix-turn-helix transcriptional regulator [Saprospiraceae bacterium]|nr:helix-turn-helix transcriptional regulator [Saprospiraceae bacterium]
MTKSLLAKNLRTLRKFNGFNQDALAQALGVTRNKIASYETQNIEPKLNLLVKISNLFKITIDDLIGTEVNEDNFDDLNSTYQAMQEGVITEDTAITPKFVLDTQAIDDFVNKNIMIGKMVDGMKTFYDFKNKNAPLSAESQQLMYILDHLMAANKEFLAELEKIKIQQ